MVRRQCMQIEETFRDLKSERFGLGFSSSRPTQRIHLGAIFAPPDVVSRLMYAMLLRLLFETGILVVG